MSKVLSVFVALGSWALARKMAVKSIATARKKKFIIFIAPYDCPNWNRLPYHPRGCFRQLWQDRHHRRHN